MKALSLATSSSAFVPCTMQASSCFRPEMPAAQTVHADFHEELCGLDVEVENLADRGLFRNSHDDKPPVV